MFYANTLRGHLPETWVHEINVFDTFLLTMAMTALGMETSLDKFRQAGVKPLLLAGVMYVWLLGGGYLLIRWLEEYLLY